MHYSALVTFGAHRGEEFLHELMRRGFPVTAAFWRPISEEDRWTLCLATELVDQFGVQAAYRRLIETTRSMRLAEPKIVVEDISLVSPSHPVVQLILDTLQKHGLQHPTWTGSLRQGNVQLLDAYVYPLPMVAQAP